MDKSLERFNDKRIISKVAKGKKFEDIHACKKDGFQMVCSWTAYVLLKHALKGLSQLILIITWNKREDGGRKVIWETDPPRG